MAGKVPYRLLAVRSPNNCSEGRPRRKGNYITSGLPVIRKCLQSVLTSHLAVPRFRGLRREKHIANTISPAHVRATQEAPPSCPVLFTHPPSHTLNSTLLHAPPTP